MNRNDTHKTEKLSPLQCEHIEQYIYIYIKGVEQIVHLGHKHRK